MIPTTAVEPVHTASATLRVATYNIHRCRGLDRRIAPHRIAEILHSLQADIIALQEVLGAGPYAPGQDEQLANALGLYWAMAPARLVRGHLYGNVILSRFPILYHAQHDLSCKWRTPRCCQRVDVQVGRQMLHVFNVHLGTGLGERRSQTNRLATLVDDDHIRAPRIVLGDFNEWGRGLAARVLTPHFKSLSLQPFLKRGRTYPGIFPVLHLDHMFYDGHIDVTNVQVPRTRSSLMASDHLPLVVDVEVRF